MNKETDGKNNITKKVNNGKKNVSRASGITDAFSTPKLDNSNENIGAKYEIIKITGKKITLKILFLILLVLYKKYLPQIIYKTGITIAKITFMTVTTV